MRLTFIIILTTIFIFNIGCTNTTENKAGIIRDSIIKYNNGRIKEIFKIEENNNTIVNYSFFDKNGILLNKRQANNETALFGYYSDTLLREITYHRFFYLKSKNEEHRILDSGIIYSHNPQKMILKFYKKDDMSILFEYIGNSIKIDTFYSGEKLKSEIKRIEGVDGTIKDYYPYVE